MKLVSSKERKDIARKYAVKIEDANIPTKVIDVTTLAEDVVEKRRENKEAMIIEISPIIKRVKRDQSLGITNVKDANNNVVYGIRTGLDQFKNITWARISLENGITLNLENIEDAKRWVVLRMHPRVKGSPFESEPLYEVNDPTIEAKKTYARIRKMEKLIIQISKMNGLDVVDSMRFLGESVDESLSFEVAKATLLELATKNPEYIYDKFGSKQRGMEAKLIAAIEYGIVENNPDSGYIYNDIPLGISVNDVMTRFEKDKVIRESILSEVNESDVVAHNVQEEYESMAKEPKESDNIF